MQHQPLVAQKRVHRNPRDEEDKRTIANPNEKQKMDGGERYEAQSSKKLKSDGTGYEQSLPIPSALTSMFSPDGDEQSGSQYDSFTEHSYQQHTTPERQYEYLEHHQPYRSNDDDYYAPERPHSGIDSNPRQRQPNRANTYPHFEAHANSNYHENPPPPRRSRSHRFQRPYASPSGAAFDAYPHQEQFSEKRSRPPPDRRKNAPAPISYVCESSRTCYPKTDLGKKIRDQVRSMTEGTQLVPAARFASREEYSPFPRGMVPENARSHRSHNRNDKTIRLLESTKDILDVHSVLGTGTFSRLTSVTIKDPNRKDSDPSKHHSHGHRPRYYACKSIKEEILVSNVARMGKKNRAQSETYLQSVEFCVLAASQLAYEAHILSCLDHPNIVSMRGLDADGILGFEKRDHRGFFLLMDVLSETLDQKINKWRREKPLLPNMYHKSNDSEAFLLRRHQEKLTISLQIASALAYLHNRRIVYRDLKPSNIGFLADDWTPENATIPPPSTIIRAQLFDFGLSRELTANQPTLRGAIGTMRYMAPEVCLDSLYDCDCDIYSFAILCWELWTQQIPFKEIATPDLYRERVCQMGFRPVYRPEEDPSYRNYSQHEHLRPVQTVPHEVLSLLSQAWKHDPKSRIQWPRIENQLKLIDTLVSLQLEERQLSGSPSRLVNQRQEYVPPHLSRQPLYRPPPNPRAHRHDPSNDTQQREAASKNDLFEPIGIEHNPSFNLRDEDLDVDLGI